MNRQAFEAAIRDKPDDRFAIDIYADWLEDQLELQHAAFLRGNQFCPHCLPLHPVWDCSLHWDGAAWCCPRCRPRYQFNALPLPAIHRDFQFTAERLREDRQHLLSFAEGGAPVLTLPFGYVMQAIAGTEARVPLRDLDAARITVRGGGDVQVGSILERDGEAVAVALAPPDMDMMLHVRFLHVRFC